MPTLENFTRIASIIRAASNDLALDNLRAFASSAERAFKTNPNRIIHIGGWHFRTMRQFESSGVGRMLRSESEYLASKPSSIVYAGD